MQMLRLFCDVAQCCSFSQAGVRHGVSQSAVSQRMGQLEKNLGVALFNRSVRPLALTEAGQKYYEGCQDILERLDKLEREISQNEISPAQSNEQSKTLSGVLVIDAIYSAGIHWLNDVKKSFERQWPQVKVQIDYKHPDAVHQAVRRRWCDLGVVSFPDQWKDVKSMALRDERMVLACDRQHAFWRGRDIRRTLPVEELCELIQSERLKLVSFQESLPVGRMIRDYLVKYGCTPDFDAHFDNLDTIKSAVLAGEVAAILPQRSIRQEVHYQRLGMVNLNPTPIRPMGLIYPVANQKRRQEEINRDGFTPLQAAFVNKLKQTSQAESGPMASLNVVANQPLTRFTEQKAS